VSAGNYVANQRDLPYGLLLLCGVLILLGIIAMGVGIASGHPETAWRAFHVNWVYFGLMSQAAICLSAALVIIGAKWAGPVRHVAESLAAWVPISIVLFVIGNVFGGQYIHANWIDGAPYGKEWWLSFPRVFWADFLVLAITGVLTLVYLRASFRPALKGASEYAVQGKRWFAAWTADWQGDDKEWKASEDRLRVLAPVLCLLYAFGFTIVVFDQVMAISPAWFSNIFGWYVLWGGWLSGICATALLCVLLKRHAPGWDAVVTKARMHDLGKMIFAFSIFWMYLFFSQYIVIWYGNLPEETEFLQARLGSQFMQDTWFWVSNRLDEPYVQLSLAAWAGCWIIPFWVLLGQAAKKTPAVLGTVAAIVLFGFWLERNALVWPSLVPEDGGAWIGGVQIGVALGFLGAFVLVISYFTRIFPTLPLPKE
jgi:hypothetical protein